MSGSVGRNVVLAEMDAIGLQRQRDVDPVVNYRSQTVAACDTYRGFSILKEFLGRTCFVSKLNEFRAAFSELEAQEKKKRSKAEILDLLRTEGDKFASFLEGLSDETLAQQITEPGGGPTKSRLEALLSAKEHEMHHRGQLMLIERMLGIVPHLTKKYAEMEREYKQAQAEKQAAPQPV